MHIPPQRKRLTSDVSSSAPAHADTDSDDSEEEDEEQVARISQNALLVSQTGKTLQPGAWRGCTKSPL